MRNLLYKKGEAIQEVKFKLSLYADIMINGFLSINDRVPSFTTSILAMPQGSGSGIGLGEKVTQAIMKEAKENNFIKTYSAIISSLSEKQQTIINRRYLKNMTFSEIEEGDNLIAGDKRAYKKLNEIYMLIACMDDDIDFSFNDYVEIKKQEKKDEFERNERKKIKAIVLTRIRLLLLQKKDIQSLKDWKILNRIPDKERELLLSYVKDNGYFSSNEYKQISRAIFTFAFYHPNIKMSRESFISSFGINGKKRATEIADGQLSLFNEEKERTHE